MQRPLFDPPCPCGSAIGRPSRRRRFCIELSRHDTSWRSPVTLTCRASWDDPNAWPVDDKRKPSINAIVPLAVLEAVRSLDRPSSVVLEELPQDFVPKRLGASRTVQGQIERYANVVARGGAVDPEEVIQLFRLVARRNDAGLVFSDAGRRAARHAMRDVSAAARGLHRALPARARHRMGFRLAQRISQRVFGVAASRDETGRVTVVGAPPSVDAVPGGEACALYGAGVSELLRTLAGVEEEVTHAACRAHGGDACRWHTATKEDR